MSRDVSSNDDMISVSDITDRVGELEDAGELTVDEQVELATLNSLLDDMRGSGGDHQWQGNWYPGEMIRESYFKEYAMQMAEDIGAIDANASWPNTCIDWDQAARELKMDYTSVEFEGVTYYVR